MNDILNWEIEIANLRNVYNKLHIDFGDIIGFSFHFLLTQYELFLSLILNCCKNKGNVLYQWYDCKDPSIKYYHF